MVLSLLYFDIIFCYVIFSSTWQEIEGDKTQRQLNQRSHEWNVTVLCENLHLHDCQHSKSHKIQRFKPVHYPEVFRNYRNEYVHVCERWYMYKWSDLLVDGWPP